MQKFAGNMMTGKEAWADVQRMKQAQPHGISYRHCYCLLSLSSSLLLCTATMSVGVRRILESVCLPVCLFVCLQHNSKTNDLKVFKLGIGNDLGIFCNWYGVERSKGQR